MVKSWNDMIGQTINTEKLGEVRIIEFSPRPEWGSQVNIYVDKFSLNTCIGSIPTSDIPDRIGGGLLVEKVDESEIE
jgi:hypothetical protein